MLKDIHGHDDLKKLNIAQLTELCEEIRQELTQTVLQNGGHLAANLGVVELSVALHYVFDDDDKIVWDVGHQSYVHKMLTGRAEEFSTLRQRGGISGFPDTTESPCDCFDTGHSGTAISAALGLATARDLKGENHNVIAVVGDGAMTGGMVYEALNNIKTTRLLVILNDNNMAIAHNVGTATLNMSRLRVGKYDANKQRLKKILLHIPLVGKPLYKCFRWCKRRAKLGFVRNSYFDNFDLKYIGIIDGNELKDLIYYLEKIKQNVVKPTLLHIVTKKGKGYAPAEAEPQKYHNVSADGAEANAAKTVGKALVSLAEKQNIAAITAAMADGVGLSEFAELYPNRFFDVGIAEEHAVTFAGGLAKGGVHPFVCVYSTFLQRSYDQILHDVALQNLPVTFLIDRSGFVGADGKTHQGLQDLSYLSNIPNLRIWTPANCVQLQSMIEQSAEASFPVAIRYAKTLDDNGKPFDGSWQVVKSGGKVKLLAVGCALTKVAMSVAEAMNVEVVCVTTVKPLDTTYLDKLSPTDVVVTMEENQLSGGFGSAVQSYLLQAGSACAIRCLGVKDRFVAHATIAQQLEENSLDVKSVTDVVKSLL